MGHIFNPIPCFDENGYPSAEDCAMTTTDRDFESGCTAAGCHSTAESARNVLNTASLRLQALHDELYDLLIQVDPGLEDEGGEIDAYNPTFTVAEGAYFNMELAAYGGPEADRADPLLAYSAAAAHNPFLMEQLLITSIQEVEDFYAGILASPSTIDLSLQIGAN